MHSFRQICEPNPARSAVMNEILRTGNKKERVALLLSLFVGDPYGNRTHVTAVKGPCLNRLTNGPKMVAGIGLEPMTYRV